MKFNFFKQKDKTPAFGDMRSHPNAISLANRLEKNKNLILELKQLTQQLVQREIKSWRTANQVALNFENPNRYQLYNLYYDAMLDLHLLGSIRNRKLKTMRRTFKVVDFKGNTNHDLTELLQMKWFKLFMSFSLDSIFYGYSLIQFGEIDRTEKPKFTSIKVVPRAHVVPEFAVVKREVSDEPKSGIDYCKPPYSLWCIGVGQTDDLGLLLPTSKDAISKKYALQFWDQFAEIFGMPIRIAKSSSRNKKDTDKIEQMLDGMGVASWGLFPEGTEIEIKETTRGDAFNVYDKRIDRANTEMSKAILGQTMTMDDGSSKSQATVHETVSDEIGEADSDMIKDVVNDDLWPFLLQHGWPIHNHRFEWDDTHEYTATEMKEIEAMLLQYYDIEPEYFTERYDIPILGVRQQNFGNIELVKKKS